MQYITYNIVELMEWGVLAAHLRQQDQFQYNICNILPCLAKMVYCMRYNIVYCIVQYCVLHAVQYNIVYCICRRYRMCSTRGALRAEPPVVAPAAARSARHAVPYTAHGGHAVQYTAQCSSARYSAEREREREYTAQCSSARDAVHSAGPVPRP